MGVFRDLLGTVESALSVGSRAVTGLRRLRFQNSAGTIDLEATPTSANTVTLPPRTGSLLVRDGGNAIGGALALEGLEVVSPGNGNFTVVPGGGNIGLEFRNTAGGLLYADFTSDAVRDFDLRLIVNSAGTEASIGGRPELSLFFHLPTQFNGFVTLNNSLTLLNTGGSKSFKLQGTTATQESIDFFVGPNLTWRLLRAPTSGDLILQRYTGGALQENLLAFSNSTGQISLTKTVLSGDPLYLRASTPAATESLQRWETAGSARWTMGKNSTAETGSNAGSNFAITSYNDAGALAETPLLITRSTGQTRLTSLALLGRLGSYDGAAPSNGQILIGNGADFQRGSLNPGPGVAITNGAGSITISATNTVSRLSANYTLTPADNGRRLIFTNTTPVTLTIPDDANIPVGFEVRVIVDRVVDLENLSTTVINNLTLNPSLVLIRGQEYILRRESNGADLNWALSSVLLPGVGRQWDEDFLSVTTLPSWLITSNAGTGNNLAAVTDGSTLLPSRPGAARLSTGTTTGGHRSIGTASQALTLGSGFGVMASFIVQVPIAATATEGFQVRAGFQTGLNAPAGAGAFFRCSSANSGNWTAVARTATTETVVNLAQDVTGVDSLSVLIIPGNSARFYINNGLVATITTNLPPVNTLLGPLFGIFKTAGITNRDALINRMSLTL